MEFAGPEAEDRVIELCCGTGDLTAVLGSKRLIKELVAVDISEQAIETARMRKLGMPVTFINASSDAIPLDSSTYTKGIISFGFHHMPRKDRNLTMLEVYRVLQPGGALYVIDYNLPEKGTKRWRALVNARFDSSKVAYQMLKEDDLHKELQQAGFRIAKKRNICGDMVQLIAAVKNQ